MSKLKGKRLIKGNFKIQTQTNTSVLVSYVSIDRLADIRLRRAEVTWT